VRQEATKRRRKRVATDDDPRLERLLELVERMAGGDLGARASISRRHDNVDALAFGLNLLGGELGYTLEQLTHAREQAERASEARAVFLRTVSHELRTPISAILGIAELLGAPGLSERERQRLGGRIMQNGRALLRLVDHLLDLSRVDAQRMELAREVLAPASVVREVVEMLEVEALRKSLAVDVTVARGAPPEVKSDPIRLRQILFNVVGNAIKYTEAGRVEIRVGKVAGKRRATAAIDVKDTGVGIARVDRARLFQPFARGGEASRRLQGNGLGLALSRRLAQALGGDLVLLESALGRGSTFRLTLPAHDGETSPAAAGGAADGAAQPESPAPPAPPAREARPLAGVRLLVADDHDDLRSALARLLVDAGADVETAADGRAAFDLALRGNPDVVLLDVEMPGLTGLDVASRLRAHGRAVPIVAVTAHVLPEERERCLQAGCSGVIIKPFDMDTLIDEIRAQLARARAQA
jgi:signal transduction histidine kinase/ActR/RegA family two-component response regulator